MISAVVVMTAQNGEELELSVADITHNHDRLYIELDYSAPKCDDQE